MSVKRKVLISANKVRTSPRSLVYFRSSQDIFLAFARRLLKGCDYLCITAKVHYGIQDFSESASELEKLDGGVASIIAELRCTLEL